VFGRITGVDLGGARVELSESPLVGRSGSELGTHEQRLGSSHEGKACNDEDEVEQGEGLHCGLLW